MKSIRGLGRPAWAWAMYDWGNSAFATTVMGVFFPIMFKDYWCAGVGAAESTFRLGFINSAASIVVAALAPVIGVIADRGSSRKKFLFFFALMGIVMTGGLFLAAKGQWLFAAGLYLFASVGFAGGNVFYDALIVGVVRRERFDIVSALGFSMGYLGGGILFAVNVLMVSKPELFGFADAGVAVKWSFLSVALWWGVFSIPVFLFVDEPKGDGKELNASEIGKGIRELFATVREIKAHKQVFLFLAAYWLYIDGVDTVIRMAVDYGMSLGFSTGDLMKAFLITQFVGFPSALIYGWAGEKVGPKKALYFGLVVYVGVVFWGYRMETVDQFYVLAVVIGMVQGGVQSLSRSFYVRLIPPERSAEFFGFYNMMGKFAAVLGPAMMGIAATVSGSPRAAILPILVLFAAGGIILAFVKEPPRHNVDNGADHAGQG